MNIVSRNMTVVEGKYGDFARSKKNHVKSQRLIKFHSCIRQQLEGKTGTPQAIKDAFSQAARSCAGGHSAPAMAGRRMHRF